jgi:hypothetical protein
MLVMCFGSTAKVKSVAGGTGPMFGPSEMHTHAPVQSAPETL